MDLSLPAIYASALKSIRTSLLIYLLLAVWGLVGVIVIMILGVIGAMVLASALAFSARGPNAASTALYVSSAYFGIVVMAAGILSATGRAGLLSYGARIRRGETPGALDFFRGIIRFTLPLFVGGVVVGMLTAIPILAFLLIVKDSLSGLLPDIFTSGWNYGRALEFIGRMWNTLMMVGIFQLLIFFWISPWDEMLVLYKLRYPEALVRSFAFVFSRRHFFRVLKLVVVNVLIGQLALLLTNIGVLVDGLKTGPGYAYLAVLLHASGSNYTAILQALLIPFYAYAQLFLLPWPEEDAAPTSEHATGIVSDMPVTIWNPSVK